MNSQEMVRKVERILGRPLERLHDLDLLELFSIEPELMEAGISPVFSPAWRALIQDDIDRDLYAECNFRADVLSKRLRALSAHPYVIGEYLLLQDTGDTWRIERYEKFNLPTVLEVSGTFEEVEKWVAAQEAKDQKAAPA